MTRNISGLSKSLGGFLLPMMVLPPATPLRVDCDVVFLVGRRLLVPPATALSIHSFFNKQGRLLGGDHHHHHHHPYHHRPHTATRLGHSQVLFVLHLAIHMSIVLDDDPVGLKTSAMVRQHRHHFGPLRTHAFITLNSCSHLSAPCHPTRAG